MKIGIIGGTGFYSPGLLENEKELMVETPFGNVKLITGLYGQQEILFLPRHGAQHSVPPHLVNYRANIWALKEAGAGVVLATAAVGSLNLNMEPGDIVLVDQFLDFTKSRPLTFFAGGKEGVLHVDVTNPYCTRVCDFLQEIAGKLGISVHKKGSYVCTEGPRYETAGEIRMFQILEGDVVGMTSVPEVVLAREAGLCYATLAIVTNFAAGISPHALSHQEVVEVMENSQTKLRRLIFGAVEKFPRSRDCTCGDAAAELGTLGLNKD